MEPIWTLIARQETPAETAEVPMAWGDLAAGEALLERLERPLSRSAIAALQAAIGLT